MARFRSAAFGLLCGLVFAAGLVVSGMTDPARVLGFLDFAGKWDPRLALVMVGAIAVHMTWLQLAPRLLGPSAQGFSVAPHARITGSLVWGAALFGVGWGIAGYCPGPAIVSVGLGVRQGVLFFVGMLGGMLLFQLVSTLKSQAPNASSDSTDYARHSA